MIPPEEREGVVTESIQSIMEKVARSFDPNKAAGIDVTVQFQLSGAQGGDWVATVRDQKLVVEPGLTQNPNLVFRANTQDVLDVFSGKLNPMTAYAQGKVQFQGDMNLAMRLVSLFRKPQ